MADYRKKSNEPELPKDGVDLNQLAELIASKVKIPESSGIIHKVYSPDGRGAIDEFDNTDSLSKLAEGMVVQRGDQSSNFDDLGGVKETKKDAKSTNNTIDLLSDLED